MSRIFSGDSRSIKAKKNIFFSFLIKGIDGLVYLLLVPVTIGYLNQYEYGIWLTLNSILMWINSFDIGLGNGMRNKLAEAIARDNKGLAKSYVSTTFFMLIGLISILYIFTSAIWPYIDWYSILNTDADKVPHLSNIIYISLTIFCLNFIFKFIGNIYLALQLPAINNMLITLGHLLSLVIIYLLSKFTTGSLLYVAVAYSSAPLIVYILAYPVTFRIYKYLKPSIKCFHKKYLSDLCNIGILFFMLQLSGIVLFALSNIIISHEFGPENVTPYNIAYRYYSVVLMVVTVVIAPMWSATTDAFHRGDILWIKSTMNKIHKTIYIFIIAIIIMTVISKPIYRLWIGADIVIPLDLSIYMGIYVAIIIWSLSYSYFLNGLGAIRLQTYCTISIALIFYPVCTALGHKLGLNGIVIGMCLLNLPGAIINTIQFNKIISNKSDGFWRR